MCGLPVVVTVLFCHNLLLFLSSYLHEVVIIIIIININTVIITFIIIKLFYFSTCIAVDVVVLAAQCICILILYTLFVWFLLTKMLKQLNKPYGLL